MTNINKNEVIDFIAYTYKKYCIYKKSVYLESDSNRNFNSLVFNYGIVEALYLNKDNYLLQLLKKKCNYNDLMQLIYEFCKETNIKSIKMFRDCGISYEDAINKYNYKEVIVFDNEKPIDFVNRTNHLILDNHKKDNTNEKETFLFLYFSYEYRDRNLEQQTINNLYNDLDYGLITLDKNRNILYKHKYICNFPRLYDSKLKKTIFIDISVSLLDIFMKLYNNHKVEKLSFRGVDYLVYDGKIDKEILQESIIGKPFSYDLNKYIKFTQVYDYNYKNKLVVVHDSNNIYFEEIIDGYYENKDFIETHLIHFEYDSIRGIISHLDHEYVFYTKEEFIKKESKLNMIGTYKKRYKTFKLDGCSIPINYKCQSYKVENGNIVNIEAPFIYCVINDLFEQKELINEYFNLTIKKYSWG